MTKRHESYVVVYHHDETAVFDARYLQLPRRR
jgi:hypothetical protein